MSKYLYGWLPLLEPHQIPIDQQQSHAPYKCVGYEYQGPSSESIYRLSPSPYNIALQG